MNKQELEFILGQHKLWLNGEGGKRANLSEVNLSGVDLSRASLSGANLSRANLSEVNLSEANLSRVDLSGANLSRASLYGANLSEANLSRANLSRVDLSEASLSKANLSGANLSEANLTDIQSASLSILPDEGDIIGWKKCKGGILAKLLIKSGTKRSNSTGRKCRAESVTVLEVIGGGVGISKHDNKTEYEAGSIVNCDKWDNNRWKECTGGIHFFITRAEAENY